MPGVVVTTAVRSGPSGAGDIESGQLFVAGETERGSTTESTLIRSFAEYVEYYGGYAAGNLWVPIKTYFEEGGSRVHVARVAGSGATTGAVTLNDSSAQPTMVLTAANVGSWSSSMTVEVLAADVSGFRLEFVLGGVKLLTTPDLASVEAAINYINSSSVRHLVVASDESTSANNPDTVSATSLSAGSNGAAVGDSDIIAGFNLFQSDLGAGAVAAPGNTGTTIWNGLRDHAAENNRIALCAFGVNDSASAAKSAASAYYADDEAKRMAFYYPHLNVEDPVSSGLTVSVSPETYAAAVRSKATQEVGAPFRAPAGIISTASSYVKSLTTSLDASAGNLLDEARVNAIRTIGSDVRIYGARSVSNDEVNWRFITFADTVNHIVVEAERRLEDFVFSTIDSRGGLFGRIRASMVGLLDPLRLTGGLFEAFDANGTRVDSGYSVQVNDENNPAASLAAGRVQVDVGVRVSSVADQISVTITKSNLTASVA